MLAIIHAVDEQIELLDRELHQLARSDPRTQALCAIFGVGPVLAAHILAELGDVHRFRRARQAVRLAGLDPVVAESADVRRRGRLSKQGSPELRWACAPLPDDSRALNLATSTSAEPDGFANPTRINATL